MGVFCFVSVCSVFFLIEDAGRLALVRLGPVFGGRRGTQLRWLFGLMHRRPKHVVTDGEWKTKTVNSSLLYSPGDHNEAHRFCA